MFYMLDSDGNLQSGPFLMGPGWQLIPEDRGSYTYPAYGWYWFDTEAEARAFFGLPPADPAEPAVPTEDEPA